MNITIEIKWDQDKSELKKNIDYHIQTIKNEGKSIDTLIKYSDSNSTLLSISISYVYRDLVNLLLELGANPNVEELEGYHTSVILKNSTYSVDLVLSTLENYESLLSAYDSDWPNDDIDREIDDHKSIISSLIRYGVNINGRQYNRLLVHNMEKGYKDRCNEIRDILYNIIAIKPLSDIVLEYLFHYIP